MTNDFIEQFISPHRLASYGNDMSKYKENLLISKQIYIPLAILEVSLRNSIDHFLSQEIEVNWYKNDFLDDKSQQQIAQAKKTLKQKKEKTSKHKIIAELSFGFWTNLFRQIENYEDLFRVENLKKVFTNLPKREEQTINRSIIFKKLNVIRRFRNRVFHYEKVVDKEEYRGINDKIYEALGFLSEEVATLAKEANGNI